MPFMICKPHLAPNSISRHSWLMLAMVWLLAGLVPLSAATINFPPIPLKTPDAAPFSLNVSSSDGGTAYLQVVAGADVISVSNGIATLTGKTGAYAIVASQLSSIPVWRSGCIWPGDGFSTAIGGMDSSHSGGIKADGSLWLWGMNTHGQLGTGDGVHRQTPQPVGTDMDWQSGSLGQWFSLLIKADGSLWGCGANEAGQLGDGTTELRTTLVQTGEGGGWKQVSAGSNHAAAVKLDGSLWTWGSNDLGQAGTGSVGGPSSIPVRVGADSDWAQVACGAGFVVAIKTNGTLWAWGLNTSGQLGLGNTTSPGLLPVQSGTATNWAKISAGTAHVIALQSDGSLWTWGNNTSGQLSLGNLSAAVSSPTRVGTSTWLDIAAGSRSSSAILFDSTLWAAGFNVLGDGQYQAYLTQVSMDTGWQHVAMTKSHLAVKADGSLWGWGQGWSTAGPSPIGASTRHLQPPSKGLGPVMAVAHGASHTLLIKTDGSLWSWGSDEYGQLGGGDGRNAPQQVGTLLTWRKVAAGEAHSLAIRQDGRLWAFGASSSGQAGTGSTSKGITTPFPVGTATDWLTVAGGGAHSIALKTNGTLWSWGSNASGQLGIGSYVRNTTPVQVGTATWSDIAAGTSHTLAIQTDGTLWAWGANANGQLGDGTTTNQNVPVQIGSDTNWTKVSAGSRHSAAIRADGTLWAWGANEEGQLGDGTTEQRIIPVQIGSATNWTDVCAGGAHTSALRTNGTLWTWGTNLNGQLADGSNVPRRLTPLQVTDIQSWSYLPRGGGMSACTMVVGQGGGLLAAGDSSTGMLGSLHSQAVPRRIHPASQVREMLAPVVSTSSNVLYQSVGWEPYAGSQRDFIVSGPALILGFTPFGSLNPKAIQRTGSGYVRGLAFDSGDDNWRSCAPISFPIPSGNAALSSLMLDGAAISPGFNADVLTYAGSVGNTTDSIRVKAVPADPGSTLRVGTSTLQAGEFTLPLPLAVGSNVLTLESVAEDGITSKAYQLTITRETAYQTWARSTWGTTNVAELDDPDLDGLPNLLEYALGLDPRSGQQPSPVTSSLATSGAQSFLRVSCPKGAAPDVTFTAEVTTNPGNPASWSNSGLIIEEDSASRFTVRDSVPFEAAQARFMRIRVTRN